MDVQIPAKYSGFTLIELMITVAILAILASIAYPSFDTSIQNSRITSQTNRILGALQFARSEASARNTDIRVCGSNDQANCNSVDWSTGFIVLDVDNANALQIFAPLEGGNQVNLAQVDFGQDGQINVPIQLTICDARGAAFCGTIQLNGSGQARIQ
ncbi:MAG: GspH/FimT family pseudopilin [Endozoicomonas sp.]|uniref:GspH/FimT family pseudopilin n=1 Tax=Endozoicomonas sp. TaxID=1892382 RepID=UPI003D9B004D